MRIRGLAVVGLALLGCHLSDLVQSPDAAGRLEFSVQPAATSTNAFITPPVRVTVLDAMGKPDTTFHDNVSVTLASNPGGASLDGDTEVSVVGGVAIFANLRIDRPGTGYVLQALAPERPATASARFNVTAPVAAALRFAVQPVTTPANEPVAPAVQVVAEDEDGQTAAGYNGPVTLSLAASPAGGTLSGTLTVAAVGGIATFKDLTIDRSGTGYKLSASVSGLRTVTSASFTVSAPLGPPRRLAFIVQPSRTRAGEAIAPPVKVAARDEGGRVVPSYSGAITISIASGAAGAVLTGTTTVIATDGVATFDDLKIDRRGNGYRLAATAPGLSTAVSASFNIDKHDDDVLVFTVQPSTTHTNVPIVPAVQVTVMDGLGMPVTTFNGPITVDVAPNVLGGRLYGTLTVIAVNGVANFTDLRMDLIGVSYFLTAAFSGDTTTVQSASFAVLP